MNSVAVRSRVGGTIVNIAFKEGQDVAQGQPLFTIDPRPLQAAFQQAEADVSKQTAVIAQARAAIEKDQAGVQQASANLAKDIAQQRNANIEAKRYRSLVGEGAVSLEQYQQYETNAAAQTAVVNADRAAIKNAQAVVASDKANLQNARAQLASSQAGLRNAQVQLGYTSIRSPIAGRTGNIQVLLGNDVKADQDVLVTVNQLSPIYISFTVPQSEFAEVQDYAKHQTLRADAIMPNGGAIAAGGAVTFTDNTVDATTGTVRIKAIFTNPNGKLWPGQYVNVMLTLATLNNALVVPDRAVQVGQQGKFVWVIAKNGTAHMQTVTTGPSANGFTVIESRLKDNVPVVVDGQLQLSENSAVRANYVRETGR